MVLRHFSSAAYNFRVTLALAMDLHPVSYTHLDVYKRQVPAPISISGNFFVIMRMDSSAAAVRKVTSAQKRPPSHSASPNACLLYTSILRDFILLSVAFADAARVLSTDNYKLPEQNNNLPVPGALCQYAGNNTSSEHPGRIYRRFR